jgi:hypothetical protein
MMEMLMESKTMCAVGLFAMRKGLSWQEWKNHTGDHDHGKVRVVRSTEG